MEIEIDQIQDMIYAIRGQKVMLDRDLAKLYGVETKVLNQAVNISIMRIFTRLRSSYTPIQLEIDVIDELEY